MQWNFPEAPGAPWKGISDAGIENFNGKELESLVRENCQNSLDAALNDSRTPVLVEFEQHFLANDEIPGITEFRDVLQKCKKAWEEDSEKAKKFFKDALKQANEKKGFVLRISDYNTTGLSAPYVELDSFGKRGGWYNLTKVDGGANKQGDKAGAFGIGKNASFCNSYYRMVFYRTLNEDNERAAQGISKLVSYRNGPNTAIGTGYFGNPNGNIPVEDIDVLEQMNQRTQTGTDVFVFGFKNNKDWENKVIETVLENFLVAIYRGQLCVKVQGKEINSKSLGDYVEKMQKNLKEGTYGHYLCLGESEAVKRYSLNFHGMGTLELRILVGSAADKLDRKVLIVRKAGMKLFRLGNISRLFPFTGILELKGEGLNRYFRSMETVAHDKWEVGRHSNPEQAKKYYEEIKAWIRETVSSLAEHISEDETNVEGLSGVLLQTPETSVTGESDDKRESVNDNLENITIIKRSPKVATKGIFYGKGDEGKRQSTSTRGTLGADGEPGMRILKGHQKRSKLVSHKGIPDPEGCDVVFQERAGGQSSAALKSVRVIKKNMGTYTVCFEVPHDVGRGRMELVTVGENGKSSQIHIKEIESFEGCKNARLSGGSIEMENVAAASKVKVVVKMTDTRDYAMEVNVYEHNK